MASRLRGRIGDPIEARIIDDSRGFSPGRTELEEPLYILMGMASLLVVLCSINVATLLLLRAASRAREIQCATHWERSAAVLSRRFSPKEACSVSSERWLGSSWRRSPPPC